MGTNRGIFFLSQESLQAPDCKIANQNDQMRWIWVEMLFRLHFQLHSDSRYKIKKQQQKADFFENNKKIKGVFSFGFLQSF